MTQTFNVDVNARQQDYPQSDDGKYLLVTKVFKTIQGEGPLAGIPAIFIRLAGCNLGAKESCPWCDSDFKLSEGVYRHIDDLEAEADNLYSDQHSERLLVLTGGEPLLQNPCQLIAKFLEKGWIVQIETNGYFWHEELGDLFDSGEFNDEKIKLVVSPKVNARMIYPNLNQFIRIYMTALKIVVDADPQSPYYLPPTYASELKGDGVEVFVSPIMHYRSAPSPNSKTTSVWGDDTPLDLKRCEENFRYAAKLVIENNWRLSMQSHLWMGVE